MKALVKSTGARLLAHAPAPLRTAVKRQVELAYWRLHLRRTGRLANSHFAAAFTEPFDLAPAHFRGKRMLDIGCGPLGTLEWAADAASRTGVDPLADAYLALNRGAHAMTYVAAPAERLPFADASFDIVSLFNALDHVEDPAAAAAEAARVLAPGGDLLLLCEIDHAPTLTEPHRLTEAIVDAFPGCTVTRRRTCAIRDDHDVYRSLAEAAPRPGPATPGLLAARLTRHHPTTTTR